MDHKEVSDLVLSIFNSFSDKQRETLRGRSNNQGRATGYSHLQLVLVDLFVAWKTNPYLSIGVSRGNNTYRVNSRYNALYISPRIRSIIDTLNDNLELLLKAFINKHLYLENDLCSDKGIIDDGRQAVDTSSDSSCFIPSHF